MWCGCDVAFIEILQSHLRCCVISPDIGDSLQMQSNSSAQFFPFNGKNMEIHAMLSIQQIWFFPLTPFGSTQIHLHNAWVCVCAWESKCVCALDYSAVSSLQSSSNMLSASTLHGVESCTGHLLCNKTFSTSCR